MEAGGELDRAVAKAVGHTVRHIAAYRPSTDLNAAFSAAERVGLLQLYDEEGLAGRYLIRDRESGVWRVIDAVEDEWGEERELEVYSEAATPALAICSAILKLKEHKDV